jgi:hypothetical protein
MRIHTYTFVLAALLAAAAVATLVSATVVTYQPCTDNPTITESGQFVSWVSKDNDAASSIITYRFCSNRAQDLRFATHMHLVQFDGSDILFDRPFAICAGSNEKRQACLDQLDVPYQGCLEGSVVARLPVAVNTPDQLTRTEIRLSEGLAGSIVRLCSV